MGQLVCIDYFPILVSHRIVRKSLDVLELYCCCVHNKYSCTLDLYENYLYISYGAKTQPLLLIMFLIFIGLTCHAILFMRIFCSYVLIFVWPLLNIDLEKNRSNKSWHVQLESNRKHANCLEDVFWIIILFLWKSSYGMILLAVVVARFWS
jgi:hypothetical protein